MNIWHRLIIIVLWLLPKRKKDETNSRKRQKGCYQSPEDSRDYQVTSQSVSDYPVRFVLSNLSKVENQGLYNSCVSQAITTAIETIAKNNNWPAFMELSRMHCWNEARKLTWGSSWRQNKGVYIRDGWKAAAKGITIEKLFPYQERYLNRDLHHSWVFAWYPSFVYRFIRINDYGDKLAAIKQALFDKKTPVVFGVRIGSSFYHPSRTEVYNPPDGETGGGHAMLIIGWDDNKRAFFIRNSWGESWGLNGCLWVSQDWLLREAYDISYAEKS